jgi:predicted TIM-barrel fold metal-dependent hydrolase
MVALARERQYLLHAHSDVEAIQKLFALWPEARVLWAHSGFEPPERVREQLRRYPRLWCDLAYRSEHANGARVDAAWRAAFEEFPERFMVGTDTFTPERWHYIGPHARSAREWLGSLPPALAEKLAWRNGEALLRALPPR